VGRIVDQIPMDIFWTLIVGWLLGVLSAWRVTSLIARMRDAIGHARHHYARAVDFVRYARDNVAALIFTGMSFVAVVGLIGGVVWLRIAG
jgi:predicted ABC-type sugar transport system permease subunit